MGFGSGQLISRAGAGERHVLKFSNCFFKLDFVSLTPPIIALYARLRVPMCLPHMNYLLQAFGAGQVGDLLLPTTLTEECLGAAKVEAGKHHQCAKGYNRGFPCDRQFSLGWWWWCGVLMCGDGSVMIEK